MIDEEDGSDNTRPAPEALGHRKQFAGWAAPKHTQGNKTRAAALLGITRTQLHTHVKRFRLTSYSIV